MRAVDAKNEDRRIAAIFQYFHGQNEHHRLIVVPEKYGCINISYKTPIDFSGRSGTLLLLKSMNWFYGEKKYAKAK